MKKLAVAWVCISFVENVSGSYALDRFRVRSGAAPRPAKQIKEAPVESIEMYQIESDPIERAFQDLMGQHAGPTYSGEQISSFKKYTSDAGKNVDENKEKVSGE